MKHYFLMLATTVVIFSDICDANDEGDIKEEGKWTSPDGKQPS